MHDHLDLVELVATLDPAHVTPGTHVLPPEARGVRDVPSGERAGLEDLVTVQRDQLRLGRGDEPHVVELIAVEVLIEVR